MISFLVSVKLVSNSDVKLFGERKAGMYQMISFLVSVKLVCIR